MVYRDISCFCFVLFCCTLSYYMESSLCRLFHSMLCYVIMCMSSCILLIGISLSLILPKGICSFSSCHCGFPVLVFHIYVNYYWRNIHSRSMKSLVFFFVQSSKVLARIMARTSYPSQIWADWTFIWELFDFKASSISVCSYTVLNQFTSCYI